MSSIKSKFKEALREELSSSSKSNKEEFIRKNVREAIQEELSTATRSDCLDEARDEIEETLNRVLVKHGVHREGLADQQCGKFYRELSDVCAETLDLFRTTRKPDDIEGIGDYEEFMDRIEDEG